MNRVWQKGTPQRTAVAGLWLLACSAAPAPPTFETSGGATSVDPGATAASGGSTGTGDGASTGGHSHGTPGAGASPGSGVGGQQACGSATRRRVRRLTQEQYQLTVTELFGARPTLLAWSSPDVRVHGFDTHADALTISSGNFEDFALSAELLAGSADVAALAPCAQGATLESCASAFAESFAERAFGRPLEPEERERLLAVYRSGAEPDGYETGIRLVIEAVLMSPNFLYQSELGDGSPGHGETSLSALEVANALSFALTGTRPDAALRDRARRDPAFLARGVHEEAARLGAEPRAREHVARFLRSWLGVRDLRAINKVPLVFPDFTPALKADLDQEIALFLGHVLGEGGGTLAALLGAPVTFVNSRVLGTVYAFDYAGGSLPPVPGDGSFVPIPLQATRRRGILSLGGWLAALSPVHRSSPVDRGLAVRSRLFCQSLPPPPPGALFSAPVGSDGVTTTRQQFEAHTAAPDCRGCHAQMDPIGFGLEMMDGIGRYRDAELGLPVDSSGVLTDTDVDGPFRGPAELANKLLASRQVRDCFVTQLFRYVEGRDEQPSDECELARLKQAFAAGDGSITELVLQTVVASSLGPRRHEP